jgi:fatty acid desaturase
VCVAAVRISVRRSMLLTLICMNIRNHVEHHRSCARATVFVPIRFFQR